MGLVENIDRKTKSDHARWSGDDSALWQGVKAGDASALEKLFREHYHLLFDYGLKLTRQEELVKDGIQEIFAYIWDRRNSLSNADSVRAYLLVSLRRHLLHTLARQQKQLVAYEELSVDHVDEVFSAEDLLVFAETHAAEQAALKKAFAEIPARMREALYLKTYDGLSYKEIAAVMNVKPQVARNYVSEAFQRVRENLLRE
jgi:RNA polymerase sigma factor (sigma-70 family)